jgi:hypothetical protein
MGVRMIGRSNDDTLNLRVLFKHDLKIRIGRSLRKIFIKTRTVRWVYVAESDNLRSCLRTCANILTTHATNANTGNLKTGSKWRVCSEKRTNQGKTSGRKASMTDKTTARE